MNGNWKPVRLKGYPEAVGYARRHENGKTQIHYAGWSFFVTPSVAHKIWELVPKEEASLVTVQAPASN